MVTQGDMRKAFVILNPGAGACNAVLVRRALERHFPANGIEYQIHEAKEGEKLAETTRARLGGGFDLFVAAGGDGTVSAVIDGLAGCPIPLGIVPTGTANLVARELNIPLGVDEAVGLIARAEKTRNIDAMRIGDRIYVLIIGVGISASVAGGTTKKNKGRFGLLAYVGAAFLKMFEFQPRNLEVVVDGATHSVKSVEIAIANCGILAKLLFPKGPDIHVDDGRLDVYILGTGTVLDYPRYLFRVLTRRPAAPRVHLLGAEKSVAIRSRRPLPVQADGDVIGTTPIEIELLPGAVHVFVPERPAVEPHLHLARDIFVAKYLPDLKKSGRWGAA
jgi:YegS/Rv2252/BmrU family lipid kinase